jgi:hypothetical protein
LKQQTNLRVSYIASSHTPLAIVENKEFLRFVENLCPNYSVPSRQTLREMILRQAEIVKEKVSLEF